VSDICKLVLYGPPRTKKTSNRLVRSGGRSHILPSLPWTKWRDEVVPQLAFFVRRVQAQPIMRPVNCKALFYRDAERGDAVGYYQGLADILQEAGVVTNDFWIMSWDGSRMLKDRDNPRVEITLSEAQL